MKTVNEMIEITDCNNEFKAIVNPNLWVAIKSADSYYRNSITGIYQDEMHDVRGLIKVFSSEDEAVEAMRNWAIEDLNLVYYGEEEEVIEELGELPNDYEGEGYYHTGSFSGKCEGFEYHYEDDLRYYSIRPLHEECAELADKGRLNSIVEAAKYDYYNDSDIQIIDLLEEE